MNTADIDIDSGNKTDEIGEELKEPDVQDTAVVSAAQPKIEAPTTQNLMQYLNSLDNNSKPMGLEDIDRKLPPSSNVVVNESELQSPIVPQFVHIPIDNNATLATKHRAPSVPDLISYSHSHERNITTATTTITTNNNVLLSNETLPNKKDNRESRKEQFEERLRRAHLRLKSDATGDNDEEEEVTRYRSRSTPSRHLRAVNDNEGTSDRRSSLYNSFGHNKSNTGILLPPDTSELETSELAVHMSIESSAPEPMSPTDQREDVDISNIAVEDTPNSMLVATNSSCKSSHGSRVSDEERNDNILLEPPPPPPPTTEKERLVERESQARLETERARRRQLALQRDRQSDGDEDDENNADLLLGDVSFDAGLEDQEMAPEFVGDNSGVVLDLPISSADSSSSIPRPPIPPPPATERERLVERERQARLETERARRRHLALQRERDDTSPDDDIEVNMDESNSVPPTSPQSDMNSGDGSRQRSTTSMEIGHQAEVPNTEAETNLSYPMERFLDRLDDEEEPSCTLPVVDIATEENNAEPSLPYTMELFLADNVAVSEQNESAADATRSDTNLAHEPINTESVVGGTSIQPRLEEDHAHQNEPSQAAAQSNMSVESINASTDNLPIEGGGGINQLNHPDNQSLTSSSSHLSVASSHDTSHHTLHLTEAEIAHLNEVEHASIGNTAPQSVRDEPSEASVTGRVIDHAFSIATQPTAIESVTVTEVSDHRGSVIESDVIRVEGPNISVQNSSSGGASVAAMPSIASSSNSSHVSDDSTGSHDNIGMPRLTEAGIGTLADIENASLGPAPPQSVRSRLSESSVAERGEHQFSSTDPIAEISSVDERDLLMMDNSDDDDSISDDHSENASVEAMPSDQSDQSVETPRVYHGEHRMHVDSDDEEMIVYQPSIIGSSASIEALPSIDESATHDYGAFHSRSFSRNSVEGFSTMDHQYDRDIESAPLLVPTRNEEQTRTVPPSEPHGTTSQHAIITPTLIVGIGTGFAVGLGLGIGLGLVRSLG